MELKADDTGTAIVPVLGCVLNQLCDRNDHLPDSANGLSKFHALRPPNISIKDYLLRIAKYAACSGECFVLALVYIDRIIQSNPTFVVNSLNIHRLLITSVMLAAKFFDDQYFNNAYYAKVGGVPRGEMNSLEVEFLFMTNFTLFVPTEQYRQYYTELCNHARNSACECSSQDGKIPDLIIPEPDAKGDLGNSNMDGPSSSSASIFSLGLPDPSVQAMTDSPAQPTFGYTINNRAEDEQKFPDGQPRTAVSDNPAAMAF